MTRPLETQNEKFFLDERHLVEFDIGPGKPGVELLAADASDRRFYRVQFGNETLICMQFPSWKGGYGGDPLSWLGMQRALEAIGLRVPKVHVVDEAHARIWTEDFGDAFLHAGLPAEGLDMRDPRCEKIMRLYEDSLDMLIQAQYPERAPPAHPAQKLAFDYEKLQFEMDFFLTHFMEGLMEFSAWRETPAGAAVRQDMQQLCHDLAARERVLCHRDYHVRNIMVHRGEACWIDFQDARMGPHTYDVVSIVRDSYVHITRETRAYLFQYYLDKLNVRRTQRGLPPMDRTDYTRELLMMGLQRNVKALGSFAYLCRVKGKPNYLQYVIPTLDTLLQPESRATAGYDLRTAYPHFQRLLEDLRHGALAGQLIPRLEAAR